MIGFDTNVLLRAMLDDDPIQSKLARAHLSSLGVRTSGFVSTGVLLEVFRVLDRRYRLPRSEIAETFRRLSEVGYLEFEQFDAFVVALDLYEKGHADFSDAVIAEIGLTAGCGLTLTFDQVAAKAIRGMELLS